MAEAKSVLGHLVEVTEQAAREFRAGKKIDYEILEIPIVGTSPLICNNLNNKLKRILTRRCS